MSFGLAKTDSFMLATATVMIGAQSALYNLNDSNAIGLVKDFQITTDPAYTELTQGVRNDVVYSVLTANPTRATMNVFEYTPTNLTYGLGLDPTTTLITNPPAPVAITATVAAAATTVQFAAASDASANWAVGRWITIQSVANPNQTHVARITASTWAAGTQTVTYAGYAVPTGVSFAIGDELSIVQRVAVGSQLDQPFFSAKVVSRLPNGKTIVLLLPKIRIVKGFALSFSSSDYGQLPFEFTSYNLVSTDPNFADFSTRRADLLVEP